MPESHATHTDAYVPGVCNINREEIAYRRKSGYLGVGVTISLLGILMLFSMGRWSRLIVIVPATLAASGFLQAKYHFCVGYAAAGQQNAREGSQSAKAIDDKASIATDKARAKQINRQSVMIGVAVTIVALLLPVF